MDTLADEKFKLLKEKVSSIRQLMNECSYEIIPAILSPETNGSREWNDSFVSNMLRFQNQLTEFNAEIILFERKYR